MAEIRCQNSRQVALGAQQIPQIPAEALTYMQRSIVELLVNMDHSGIDGSNHSIRGNYFYLCFCLFLMTVHFSRWVADDHEVSNTSPCCRLPWSLTWCASGKPNPNGLWGSRAFYRRATVVMP